MTNRKAEKPQASSEQQEPRLVLPDVKLVDPFDNLAEHAGTQDYIEQAGVAEERLRIPVGKRDSQKWIRVHPDPAYRTIFAVLELKGEGVGKEFYLVSRDFAKNIEDEIRWRTLFLGVTRAGTPFIWPIRIPTDRKDTWAATELECAEMAMKTWIRVKSDKGSSCFQPYRGDYIKAEPVWPKMSFNDILKTAFQGDVIMSFAHPAVVELLGDRKD